MKVLMSHFTIESNEHVQGYTELDSFNLKFEDELIDAMYVKDVFEKNDIEIIPGIFANGHSGKVLSKESYEYIHSKFMRSVKENLKEIDGIYLFLHGASKVEGLNEGSGERQILKDIRKITGPYFPIFVVVDPHGNLTEEYVGNMTLGRSYRHSPHTDIKETHIKVAELMIDYLKNNETLRPSYRKLPFVLGGERSVSTDEPMVSINKKLEEIEADERILSVSFHVGYLRHDNYAAGSGLIIVPSKMEYEGYAKSKLDELYDFCVERYDKFKYHGTALDVEETLKQSIEYEDGVVVVTDSGDNVTSGALGNNTYLLKQYLELEDHNDKRILFAALKDEPLFYNVKNTKVGETIKVSLGEDVDYLSSPVNLELVLKEHGTLQQIFGDTDSFGETLLFSIKDKPIDIVLIDVPVSFAEMHQYEAAKIDKEQYDIIVVKQGYIFPELKEYADYAIMALTDGATNQQTEKLVFKQIKRPMMPFDKL